MLFRIRNNAGAPGFSYQVAGWSINRDFKVITPESPIADKERIWKVLNAMKTAGASIEGTGSVTLSMYRHNGNTLRNLANLIWSKQTLIQKALDRQEAIIPASFVKTINAMPIDSLEDFADVVNHAIDAGEIEEESNLEFDLADKTIQFCFLNASLESDEVNAFITLCWQLNEQAKKQKFSSTIQRGVENDKYAMRCFLLKLGFIGDEFKTERKILLRRLDGNAAYAKIPKAKQAAEEKRKAPGLEIQY